MRRYSSPPKSLTREAVSFVVKPALRIPRELRPAELTFRLYWRVYVFASKEAMHRYEQWRNDEDRALRFLGMVIPMPVFRVDARGYVASCRPKLGELLLHRQRLGTAVLCHESIHMATESLRAVALLQGVPVRKLLGLGKEIDDKEERLAYVSCELCRQIVDALYEHHLVQG